MSEGRGRLLIYLGWIVAAFLSGILFSEWMKRRKPSLQSKAKKAAVFRGKTYQEVLCEIDTPQKSVRQPDGRTLCTWQEDGYSISLLFDSQDVCLGVEDEHF